VRQAFDHPGFVTPFAEGLAVALATLASQGVPQAATRLLFTTHSVPLSMAAASGPPGVFGPDGAYVAQHLAAIEAVVAAVAGPVPAWSLVYQSRSGSPHVPWLEPDVNDAIRAAAGDGARAVVVVPIGFVSDHLEVAWDLDHEARETADGLGLRFLRVATPGTHPAWVSGLVDLVAERVSAGPVAALSPLGPWPAVCAPGCCANARGPVPSVAGSD